MDFIVPELQILLAVIDEGGHVNATRQGLMGSGNLNRMSLRHHLITHKAPQPLEPAPGKACKRRPHWRSVLSLLTA